MRELGAAGPSFPTIVAAGENAALPHHEASDREIGTGELVIIDMGAIVDGYCSDCTRTFATGELEPEAADVYELVRSTQAKALEAVAAGVSGKDADSVSRGPIADAGPRRALRARAGARRGDRGPRGSPPQPALREHARRRATWSRSSPASTCRDGFGVRIEDLVAITDDGVRNLSSLSKDLRVVA